MSNVHPCYDHFGDANTEGTKGRPGFCSRNLSVPETLTNPVDLWEEARAGEQKAVSRCSAPALTCSHPWPIKPFHTPSHQRQDFSSHLVCNQKKLEEKRGRRRAWIWWSNFWVWLQRHKVLSILFTPSQTHTHTHTHTHTFIRLSSWAPRT